MAFVYPFRGYRYNKEAVGNFDKVVTQPYDKTTPAMQDEYYRRSPFNVVRITLNLEKRNNPETSYPEAGSVLRKWIQENVLVQDPAPAMYAYHQEYLVEGRIKLQKGLIALLDLQDSESGIIPHEHTLAAPKQDRLALMRSIEGNEDLIYMLYSDASLSVNQIVDKSIAAKKPDMEVTDDYGASHRIWAVTDADALQRIHEALRPQKLFIADGHHRFETSVNYMKECREKGWKPAGNESFDKRMVACFNSADGVTILPTHRLVRDLENFDAQSFLHSLEELFDVETVASAAQLWEKLREGTQDHVFGMYLSSPRDFYLLRLKRGSEIQDQLDVTILHTLILDQILGINPGKLAAQSHLDYVRERDLCIRLVDEGSYQAAFFLNPTTAEQMQQIASQGKRMPQKSTDFYPKLLTGLVFMKMRIEKASS